MITRENMIKTTRITICNYNTYQDIQQADNNLITTKQQADNNLITTTKERKNEKKDKNEKKIFIAPQFDEVEFYFSENGYPKELAKRFFDSYSVADWFDSKGNKVKNWKQKAINVWFKPENKIVEEKQKQLVYR